MFKLNLVSKPFAHAFSSTWYKKSKYISWEYNTKQNPITFYIDGDLFQGINDNGDEKLKFLWGLESPCFNNGFINHVKNNLEKVLETYEMIFTYSDELLSLHPKFKFVPANGFWIEESKIYDKSKLVSMICSDKQWTELQKFRVQFANENVNKMDVFGHLCKGIQKKEEGLIDYMFSVCIENSDEDSYFTEKILDAFATGTIPIYKGTKKISEHFNPSGIFFLDDISLDDLNPEMYYSRIEYVRENFERVQSFNVLEDYMYETYLSNYLK